MVVWLAKHEVPFTEQCACWFDCIVGLAEGIREGLLLRKDGLPDGFRVCDGFVVGCLDNGCNDGFSDGFAMLGLELRLADGRSEGLAVGLAVGYIDGCIVGMVVGISVGFNEGLPVDVGSTSSFAWSAPDLLSGTITRMPKAGVEFHSDALIWTMLLFEAPEAMGPILSEPNIIDGENGLYHPFAE
jgi:hypothetical protein